MATVFSGGSYINTTFTGTARSDIMSNLKTQLLAAGWTARAYVGGGLGIVGTFTVTIASPGVVTYNTHGLSNNDTVVLQTSGALPTGLSVNTKYFVRNVATNTFELATTSGGTSINTSGSQSGTHTLNSESILLETAVQSNVTNGIRVRLKDNRGNCVQVSIENTAGTVLGGNSTTAGGSLLPAAAKTFRIIATQFHFLCFTPGASATREFVMAGMLNIPSFITSITDHGYMFCDSVSDTDSTARKSFRTRPSLSADGSGNTGYTNMQFIWNANILENANNNNYNGLAYPDCIVQAPPLLNYQSVSSVRGYRWANDDLNTSDVLVASGLSVSTDEAKIKGQLYDMIYIAEGFTVDATDTFNSHTWLNLTNNNLGTTLVAIRGGIWVATS